MASLLVSVVLLLRLAQATNEGYFTRQYVEEQFNHCGKKWGCYRRLCEPTNITQCEYIAMYKPNPATNEFEFILSTSKGEYAAIGFSADQRMGDDEVVACIRGPKAIQAGHYFNPKKQHASRTSDRNHLNLNASLYENGQLFCHITRPIPNLADPDYFNMEESWYHLYAFGPLDQNNKIAYHKPLHRPPTSDRKIKLFNDFPETLTIKSASSITSPSAMSITMAISSFLVVFFNL